jgi:hypothetical protein
MRVLQEKPRMNLHEQLGALEVGVDQLIQAIVPAQAENIPATPIENAVPEAKAEPAAAPVAQAEVEAEAEVEAAVDSTANAKANTTADKPTLQIGRPAQNEITMTIGGQTVSLHSLQVGQLIEELSNARASMTPEPPPGVPPGWRFVSTRNPAMAVQKQSNGDRLLVLRHTGHGWVPFTFSPDVVIQMYMLLSKS